MITVIFAHPWHGSYNKAILDAITSKYEKTKQPYTVLDLNKDNFNPVMTEEELALYSEGKYTDPLVGKYQSVLRESEKVLFVFPVWWGTAPAILRGFLDKVFLVNFSHTYENGWTPLLSADKTIVITTSQSPTNMFSTSIGTCFIKDNLEAVGFKNILWLNCDNVGFGTDEHRRQFIQKVESAV